MKIMAREVALTTIDNPFDPFDDFDRWWMYDMSMGYNTCGWLANMAHGSPAFSDEMNSELNEMAMDELVENDPLGIRCKIIKQGTKVS